MLTNNAMMFVLHKVVVNRRDPLSKNLCMKDSTSNYHNIYEQTMGVNYSTTVSVLVDVFY